MTEQANLSTVTVFVGLGSNLGHSAELIRAAIKRLQDFSRNLLRQSSLWQTSPVDCPPGSNDFINAVVGMMPLEDVTPKSLLAELQAIEIEFGRQQSAVLNAPRPLDLDLLVFGQHICQSEILILPHPRLTKRRFVLQPLCEIAPQLIIPGYAMTVRELLQQLNSSEMIKKL